LSEISQGVVADVKPDEAWVLTCNRFTDEAARYAKGFDIRLATLREFATDDWENRVRTIITNIQFMHVRDDIPQIALVMDDADRLLISTEFSGAYSLDDDFVKIFDGNSEMSYGAFQALASARVPIDFDGEMFIEHRDFDGWIAGRDGKHLKLNGIEIGFPIVRTNTKIEINADITAARLLLSEIDGLDFVLWEDALVGYTIDAEGKVHLADEAIQKRLMTSIEHS
jgi:hypothetical protein